MAGDSYRERFLCLTLEEKVRVAAYARSMGFRITCFGEEIEGLEPVEIPVIPGAEISSEHFPHHGEDAIEALQRFYAESYPGSYPPLGYAPSMSKNEKLAATLAKWMCTMDDEDGGQSRIDYGYPVERLADELEESPVEELIPGVEAVLGKTPISGLKGWLTRFSR